MESCRENQIHLSQGPRRGLLHHEFPDRLVQGPSSTGLLRGLFHQQMPSALTPPSPATGLGRVRDRIKHDPHPSRNPRLRNWTRPPCWTWRRRCTPGVSVPPGGPLYIRRRTNSRSRSNQVEQMLRPPLIGLPGLGETAAEAIDWRNG